MSDRQLLVTHHAPDLDAVGAVWVFKRFHAQVFADAKIAFVNPGATIELEEAEKFGCQLHQVTHVDTGLGEFDHHMESRAQDTICATSLVYDYVSTLHPELKEDAALKLLVAHVTEIDHFKEIFWPEPDAPKHIFSLHMLLRGNEYTDPHNDDSQMHFGLQCLDNAYAMLTQRTKAQEVIEEKGRAFPLRSGMGMALLTRNDESVKLAQMQGYQLVIRKDPKLGDLRIKVRPDSEIVLELLYAKILERDRVGSWFYHPNGKMLINGSRKDINSRPSPLSLEEVIDLVKALY